MTKNNESTDKTAVLQVDPETLKKDLQKAKEQESCLIVVRGNPQGHRYFITLAEMTIGRDPSVEISVPDASVSRKHAKVQKVGEGKVKLTDLGSSNGSFVNDKKLSSGESVLLVKEDMVKLGNSIFKFLPAGELEILAWENLENAANTDPLTKIYNKRYLLEALEAEFKRAKALHTDFSILFFDLDHFKKVNDTHGHEAGDYVLKEFCALVRASYLRPKDVFARYGGEEFVILMGNTSAQVAAEIAEKVRASIEMHAFVYQDKRIPVTSSFGVAELTSEIESAKTLLSKADKALYEAKGQGRNRVVVSG